MTSLLSRRQSAIVKESSLHNAVLTRVYTHDNITINYLYTSPFGMGFVCLRPQAKAKPNLIQFPFKLTPMSKDFSPSLPSTCYRPSTSHPNCKPHPYATKFEVEKPHNVVVCMCFKPIFMLTYNYHTIMKKK